LLPCGETAAPVTTPTLHEKPGSRSYIRKVPTSGGLMIIYAGKRLSCDIFGCRRIHTEPRPLDNQAGQYFSSLRQASGGAELVKAIMSVQ